VPDGTVMTPGQTFLKSWEIENTGEVPWPDGTELRLVDGPAMGPLESVTLNSRAAGERTEISVELKAPDAAGTYRTYWQLCVGEACFGTRFYVDRGSGPRCALFVPARCAARTAWPPRPPATPGTHTRRALWSRATVHSGRRARRRMPPCSGCCTARWHSPWARG
jgi:hypothetical protein